MSLNHIKKNRNIIDVDDEQIFCQLIDKNSDLIETFNKKDISSAIKKEIERLPIKLLQVAQLYFVDDLTIREISEILNTPASTVRQRKVTAQECIQKNLLANGYEPERYFSVAGIPVLYLAFQSIIREYGMSNELASSICSNVINVYYKESKPMKKKKGETTIAGLSSMVFVKLAILIVITVTLVGAMDFLLRPTSNREEKSKDERMARKVATQYGKIGNVTYNSALTRESTEIFVELMENVKEKDIHVRYDNHIVDFVIEKNSIVFSAQKNGVYTVDVVNDTRPIVIDTIDQKVPVVLGAKITRTYTQLQVQDEYNRLDFSKSYVLYLGKEYAITSEGKVLGSFNEDLEVFLFDRDGKIIEFTVKVN